MCATNIRGNNSECYLRLGRVASYTRGKLIRRSADLLHDTISQSVAQWDQPKVQPRARWPKIKAGQCLQHYKTWKYLMRVFTSTFWLENTSTFQVLFTLEDFQAKDHFFFKRFNLSSASSSEEDMSRHCFFEHSLSTRSLEQTNTGPVNESCSLMTLCNNHH